MTAGASAKRGQSHVAPDIVFVGSSEVRGKVGKRQGVLLVVQFTNQGGDAVNVLAELLYDEQVSIARGHWFDRPSQSIWLRPHETAGVLVALRTAEGGCLAFDDSRQPGIAYSVAEDAEQIEPIPLKATQRLRLVIKANNYHRRFEFDVDLNGDHMSCELSRTS